MSACVWGEERCSGWGRRERDGSERVGRSRDRAIRGLAGLADGRRLGGVSNGGDVGSVGDDNGAYCAPNVVAAFRLELRGDVWREEVGQEVVDNIVDDSIEEYSQLDGDFGNAFGHCRSGEVPIGLVEASK